MRPALFLVFAIGCTDAGVQTGTQAIIGGTTSPQDRATVALVGSRGVYCSGVVIDATRVLTAAHCLPPHIGDPLERLAVFFGADFTQGGATIAVVRARAHPAWSPDVERDDIGIVELADPSPVAPAAIAPSIAEIAAGETLRAVGYGVAQTAGAPGVKRSGAVAVETIDEATLRLRGNGEVTCDGDSGGPLFAAGSSGAVGEVVVGIDTRSNCQTAALAERVDVHAGFVADFIAGRDPGVDEETSGSNVIGGCRSTGDASWALLLAIAGFASSSRRRRRSGVQ